MTIFSKHYAGIGSRKGVPEWVLSLMTSTAKYLRKQDYILRSGNASGADLAFEEGSIFDGVCQGEIYLPKKKYNCQHGIVLDDLEQFKEFAKIGCPHFNKIKNEYSRNCYLRNVAQLIGNDAKNPKLVDFTLAFTPKGEIVGGTGANLILSTYFDIPIFNYGLYVDKESCIIELVKFLKENMK